MSQPSPLNHAERNVFNDMKKNIGKLLHKARVYEIALEAIRDGYDDPQGLAEEALKMMGEK